MEKLKEKFLASYANLLEPLREEIIVVIEGKTYTWNSAYFEVTNDTALSKEILKTLKDLEII